MFDEVRAPEGCCIDGRGAAWKSNVTGSAASTVPLELCGVGCLFHVKRARHRLLCVCHKKEGWVLFVVASLIPEGSLRCAFAVLAVVLGAQCLRRT